MTDLMEKYNYRGWYIGIMDEDTYAMEEKETQEFGSFSKSMAKKCAYIFNKIVKKSIPDLVKGKYAVAISGREALAWKIVTAEKQAGWSRNP
jgi:hypothetical protein